MFMFGRGDLLDHGCLRTGRRVRGDGGSAAALAGAEPGAGPGLRSDDRYVEAERSVGSPTGAGRPLR